MGKNKDKDQIPNLTNVANRDILQRLNFLYQASVLLNGLAPSGSQDTDLSQPSTIHSDRDANTVQDDLISQRKKRRRVVSFEELSRSYVETMKSVGQKTNVRMDPSVKRRICKRCSAPLIPGVSATVRIKDSPSHGHLISYRCYGCQTERRIPAPPVLHVDPSTTKHTAEVQQPAEVSTSIVPTSAVVTSAGDAFHPRRRKSRKGGPQPRLPPHFARDVGHVVFRGNERLDMTDKVS